MNISQHAFVPYTRYVKGYYKADKTFVSASGNIRSNRLMPLPLGVNYFQLFNFPRVSSSYATLRMYDPSSNNSTVDGITTMTSGELFSTTRTSAKPLDVRVVGWNQPVPQLVGLGLFPNVSTNEINNDDLI